MLKRDQAEIKVQAKNLFGKINIQLKDKAEVSLSESSAYLGSGSLPDEAVKSWAVLIRPEKISLDELAKRLRTAGTPVFSHIRDSRLWLDMRTVFPEEVKILAESIIQVV